MLPLGLDVEAFALPQVCPLKGAAYDENVVLLLSDAEVDPVVHHFAESLEFPLRNIKLNDLGAGYVGGPIETLRFIPSDDENILLVNYNDFTLADLSVIDFERGPSEGLEVIEGVLVKFREVK